MKKILSVLLALILCLSLCGMAFAAPVGSEQGDVTITVEGVADEPTAPVYNVEFKWDSLIFTYDFKETNKYWDTDKHEYVTETEGTAGWNKTSAAITVVNHSNAKVTVSAAIGGTTTVTSNGVTASLTNSSYTINSAEGTAPANAPSGTTTVTVSGVPADKSGFTLGTVVVSVNPAN